MQVVGLDIGYSNLKLAFGRAGTKPDIRVLPAMAAPIEHVAVQLEGASRASPSGIPVRLDGQAWVAGVRPTRISGWSRALHARYADSDAYRALVQGDDQLISVISEGTVLILDVGFFSVDWAVLVQGDLRRTATGTSLDAMSVVIETAAGLIGAEASGPPPVAVIERALAEGRMAILYQGRRVDLLPALQQASAQTARGALEALRQDLRREQTAVDRILVTGGGSA